MKYVLISKKSQKAGTTKTHRKNNLQIISRKKLLWYIYKNINISQNIPLKNLKTIYVVLKIFSLNR